MIFITLLDRCVRNKSWALADVIMAELELLRFAPSNYTLSTVVTLWSMRGNLDKAFECLGPHCSSSLHLCCALGGLDIGAGWLYSATTAYRAASPPPSIRTLYFIVCVVENRPKATQQGGSSMWVVDSDNMSKFTIHTAAQWRASLSPFWVRGRKRSSLFLSPLLCAPSLPRQLAQVGIHSHFRALRSHQCGRLRRTLGLPDYLTGSDDILHAP